eukprot:Skav205913  [mRNA]  locus=scaffold123:616255:616628:+ [translate_table: standard]
MDLMQLHQDEPQEQSLKHMQKQLQRTASAHVRRLERAYVEEEQRTPALWNREEMPSTTHTKTPRHTKTYQDNQEDYLECTSWSG